MRFHHFGIATASLDQDLRAYSALGYRSEVEYYARVADRMRIPVPRCFFSDISDDSVDFVLVLADMAPAVQGDQIAGCTASEAALAVVAAATISAIAGPMSASASTRSAPATDSAACGIP